MRFQKLEVLEKHFKEAYPKHLSLIYGVACAEESERKKILSSLAQRLAKQCDLKKCTFLTEALEHLNSSSFFSEKIAAVLDGIDSLGKEELDLLMRYVKFPNPKGHLILGAANPKAFSELYRIGKKEMVVLDLSKEKPWEEKERLQNWVKNTLARARKKIDADALEHFLHRLPSDRLLLEQELEKLICYLGEKENVSRSDIETICCFSEEINFFKLARDLVWEQKNLPPPLTDIGSLLLLIGSLRSQYELGLKMSALLRKKASREEIHLAFPKLWPKALEQMMQITAQKGGIYFKKGMQALYDLEFGLKTSQGKPETLFARFCMKNLS